MWSWANGITNYRLRRNTLWNPFNDVYLLSKFDVSSFPVTGDTKIFKLVILLPLSSSEMKFILITLGKSKLSLLVLLYYAVTSVAVILLNLGKTCREKQPKPSRFDKNQEPRYFQWFSQQESRTSFRSQ